MASEGQFPKVNGDILYASEVNNFYYTNGSPLYQFTGSKIGIMAANGSIAFGSIVLSNLSGAKNIFVSAEFVGEGPSNSNFTPSLRIKNSYFRSGQINCIQGPIGYESTFAVDVDGASILSTPISVGLNFGHGDTIYFYGKKDANAGSGMVANIKVFGDNNLIVSGSF